METTTHNHGGGGEVDGPCADAGMKMFFHIGYCETVLFEGWRIDSTGSMIGSAIGILILAVLYECLKQFREYLYTRKHHERRKTPSETDGLTTKNASFRNTIFSGMHVAQTFLQAVQMLLSYFLMLIFMTYNVWLCLAVIIGGTLGYFLMGWRKTALFDMTEHCH